MIQINLWDDTFSHLTNGNLGYSTARKKPKQIEYVRRDKDRKYLYSLWTNDWAYSKEALAYSNSDSKIAWMIESPEIYQKLEWDYLAAHFDLVFTHDSRQVEKNPDKFKWVQPTGSWIPYDEQKMYHDKSKQVCFLTSNKKKTPSQRLRQQIIDQLGDRFDVFGKGYRSFDSKVEILRDYKYCVVVENAVSPGYFTEKILDSILTGTIPIYYGSPDIERWFDTNGMLRFNTIEELGVILDSLDQIKVQWLAMRTNYIVARSYDTAEDYYARYLLFQ